MPDREKVIKEFELYIKEFHPACTSEGVELDMLREVLALLKEQEPVKPTYEDFFGTRIARCGNCNGYIVRYRYCPGCGKQAKWE